MDKTPISKSSLLTCRGPATVFHKTPNQSRNEEKTPSAHQKNDENTPLRQSHTMEDSTPLSLTQQGISDTLEVAWDWNSPQTSRRLVRKRLLPASHSPGVPLKRHPSNNQMPDFEKLKSEFISLRDELSRPDDEESLRLSPLQEEFFKNVPVEAPDPFDSLLDEQLVQFSQQMENDCQGKHALNDSLDDIFSAVKDEEINRLTQKFTQANRVSKISRAQSEGVMLMETGKMEFGRTRSFEIETKKTEHGGLPKQQLEIIERKRLEAIAKLQQKKQKPPETVISSSKCSPEQIEQKRQQALKKLEIKRIQDIIEKNKQEALRRLQMTKMRNSGAVQSLIKRL